MSLYRGHSAPNAVRKKPNGMWTFDHHSNGVWKEYGDFPDEPTATKERKKLNEIWEAENGKGYIVDSGK
jgi:hypothetical protein